MENRSPPTYKRIISLILSVLLVPALLAFPARAEDIGPWLNVLDFSTANGSGSNFFNVTSGQVVEYDIPGSSLVTSVDLVVYSLNVLTGADISRNGSAWQTATVTDLGDSYYRITLDTNRVFQGVYMRFFYEESGANTMQVISLKVAVADMAKYYIPINGTVYDYASSPTNELVITKNADNLPSNTVSWFPNNDSTITYFRASLPITDWAKYDKIHVVMSLYSATFDSIDVTHSGFSVPFEYNLINGQSGGTHINYIDIVIDVSGFDRAVTSPFTIQISGTSTRNNDSINKLSIYSAIGVIVGDTIDPITYWFTQLNAWITNQTNSILSGLSSQTSSLSTAISNLGTSIGNFFTTQTTNIGKFFTTQTSALSSALSDLGDDIGDFFTTQTSSLTTALSSLGTSIGNFFTTQTTNIGKFFTTLGTIVTDVGDELSLRLSNLISTCSTGFLSLKGSVDYVGEQIITWGQNIVDALNPQADTDGFREDVENIRDQMQDANDAMNELERPSVDDVFSDIDLDIGADSPFVQIMGSLFENDFVVSIVTGSLAFSIFGLLVG